MWVLLPQIKQLGRYLSLSAFFWRGHYFSRGPYRSYYWARLTDLCFWAIVHLIRLIVKAIREIKEIEKYVVKKYHTKSPSVCEWERERERIRRKNYFLEVVQGLTGGDGGGKRAYNEIRFTESTCRELEGTVAEYFDWCAVLKTCVGDSWPGDINIEGKMECDDGFNLKSYGEGDIFVKKLRGKSIRYPISRAECIFCRRLNRGWERGGVEERSVGSFRRSVRSVLVVGGFTIVLRIFQKWLFVDFIHRI